MLSLYKCESSYAKPNAQANLAGRTHYVDDDTLRFHKSRVLSSHVVYNGLLFAIVTSDALDMHNTKRGFRYAIFDLFGTVVDRPKIEEAFRTRAQATKAMWNLINTLDAKALTEAAIKNAEYWHSREMAELRNFLTSDGMKAA
jgi:hypothetical protein